MKKLTSRPLIAVLRHITPDEVVAVCDILVENGFSLMEVTVNTVDFDESLIQLVKRYPKDIYIGAGTVVTMEELERVHEIGVSYIVSPHTDVEIIKKTKSLGLRSYPGCFTPSEAFAALQAGADVLKFFPASWAPPQAIKDLRAVLPKETIVYGVGGVGANNFLNLMQLGIDGFGIGNALYKKGITLDELKENSKKIVTAYDEAYDKIET